MKQGCLDYFIIFGQRRLDHLVSKMTARYHEVRPYQSKKNDLLVPIGSAPSDTKRNRNKEESPPDVVPVS